MVIAASRRSRQRSSPLRGGHGGGLCPFVVVTAEVFFTPTQKQRKKSLHMRLPPFLSQEPAWGLRLFAALAPPGAFSAKSKKKSKTSRKKPPPLAVGGGHVAVFAAPPWRSRRSFADTAGGHGGHLRRPTAIWRLKRHNLSFAFAAGLNFSLRLSAWHTTRTRRRDPRRGPRPRHAHRTHGARAGRNARARTRRASYLGSVVVASSSVRPVGCSGITRNTATTHKTKRAFPQRDHTGDPKSSASGLFGSS